MIKKTHQNQPLYFLNIMKIINYETYLASLLRMDGDLLTLMVLGDFSKETLLVSSPFSNTWYRDFTLRVDNSSKPRSGLSDAVKSKKELKKTLKNICTE